MLPGTHRSRPGTPRTVPSLHTRPLHHSSAARLHVLPAGSRTAQEEEKRAGEPLYEEFTRDVALPMVKFESAD